MRALLEPASIRRLLVLAPHPDDETLGCGELMQAVVAAGGEVRILLLTDGEANPWPQRWIERRWRLDGAARARWGRRRLDEMRAALQCQGLGAVEVVRMGWPDQGVTAQAADPGGAGWRALAAQMRAWPADRVLAPELADRHPDHGSAHVLAQLALDALGPAGGRLLTYGLHGRTAPAGAGLGLAADAARAARKQAAVECYASQLRLSGRRFRAWARRPETYRTAEPVPAPGAARLRLPWQPGWLVRHRLRLTVVDPDGVQSWRWRQAPLARAAGGHYDLFIPGRARGAGPCFVRLARERRGLWIFDAWGWSRPGSGEA